MTGKNTYLECCICILPTLMLIKMLTLICKKYQVTSMTTDGLHNTGVVASSVRKSIGQLFPLTNHYNISVFQDSVIVPPPFFIFHALQGSAYPLLQIQSPPDTTEFRVHLQS